MIVTASEPNKACVMNVITHDTAYSFFPWATFEERRSLICLDGDDIREKAFRKYSDRGWMDLCDAERPASPENTQSLLIIRGRQGI